MSTILSIAVVVASVFGTEWLVDGWLGEDRRAWVAYGGLGVLLFASALVQASGVQELTRFLRKVLLGAQIGAVMRRLGLELPWLRRGLRMVGIETEPETRPQEAPRWSKLGQGLLVLGWASSLVGIGMVWTGASSG